MHNDQIIYLQPLNERLRIFLRLDFLFKQAKYTMQDESLHSHHACMLSLMEILTCVNQQDLKKEVLKELERINLSLAPLQEAANVKHTTLDEILNTIQTYRKELLALSGPIAHELRDDEFLKTVQQRNNIPGGLSEHDPPVYHYWLRQSAEIRIGDLNRWMGTFEVLSNSVELILNMVMQSTTPQHQVATGGTYQQSLDTKVPYQMIMVALPADSPYFAEISGGKHRFSVRFMDTTVKNRPAQTGNDVEFELSCCAL